MKWNEQLRHERQSQGWAQGWVAKELGTTTDTVNRWENGKTFPSPFYRQQLSKLFGKTIEELGLFRDISEDDSDKSKKSALASEEEHMSLNYETKSIRLIVAEEAHDEILEEQQPSQLRKFFSPPLQMLFARCSILLLIAAAILYVITYFYSPELMRLLKRGSVTQSSVTPLGTSYEAEAPENTLAGGAKIRHCPSSSCSGRVKVTNIGKGGTLQFNNIMEKNTGIYMLTIYYTDGNNLYRTGLMSVNGGPTISFRAPSTGDSNIVGTISITVSLNAGTNTIKFSNPLHSVPDIDRIVVSPMVQPSSPRAAIIAISGTNITMSGTSYEAEAPDNTMIDTRLNSCSGCSAKERVAAIIEGASLQFNHVGEGSTGKRTLTIYYLAGDQSTSLLMSVNSGPDTLLHLAKTPDWSTPLTLSVIVSLNTGNNTIKFYNPLGSELSGEPRIDRIVV